MIKMFLSTFNWYPKRLDLTEHDLIDDMFQYRPYTVLQSFLSYVVAMNVENGDYRNDSFADRLTPLWRALAKSSSLTSVTFSACVTNLSQLFDCMIYTMFSEAEEKRSEVDVNQSVSSSEDEEDDFINSEFDYSPI